MCWETSFLPCQGQGFMTKTDTQASLMQLPCFLWSHHSRVHTNKNINRTLTFTLWKYHRSTMNTKLSKLPVHAKLDKSKLKTNVLHQNTETHENHLTLTQLYHKFRYKFILWWTGSPSSLTVTARYRHQCSSQPKKDQIWRMDGCKVQI